MIVIIQAEAGKYGVVVVVGGERCWLTRAGRLQARILEEMRSSQRIVGNHCAHCDSGRSSWLRRRWVLLDVVEEVVVVVIRKGGESEGQSVGRSVVV